MLERLTDPPARLLNRVPLTLISGMSVRSLWDRLSPLPGGKHVFSRLVARIAPYSGSIGAVVEELGPGHARAWLRERTGLLNPFDSVHAIALANLGELVTGLAMLYEFPADARGILTHIDIDYFKKARGVITGECDTEVVTSNEDREVEVVGELRDEARDLVARVRAKWRVGPRPE